MTLAITPTLLNKIIASTNSVLLDVRHQQYFTKGYIPKSLFIGIDGPFNKWIQELIINKSQAIIVVAPIGREEEIISNFTALGYTNIIGFVKGGFEAWKTLNETPETINSITATNFEKMIFSYKKQIFDIRKKSEFEIEHIQDTLLVPLEITASFIEKFPKNKTSYIFCGGGYRSVIAISILKSNGFKKIIDVTGGFKAIKNTSIPLFKKIS